MTVIQVRITNKWLRAIEESCYECVAGTLDRNTFWTRYKYLVTGFRSCPEYRELQSIIFQHVKQCMAPGCKRGKGLEMDHIEQVILAPELALEHSNVQLLCKSCHKLKTEYDRTDFYARFDARYSHQPTRPQGIPPTARRLTQRPSHDSSHAPISAPRAQGIRT